MVAISPALIYTWLHPDPKRLPEIFTLTALGFFLCSFQVHEKRILLPLLPASLLLLSPDPIDRPSTIRINTLSTISYLPYSLLPNHSSAIVTLVSGHCSKRTVWHYNTLSSSPCGYFCPTNLRQ